MPTSGSAARQIVTQAARQLELPIPPAVVDGFAEADRLARECGALVATHDQLAGAVLAAIRAGRDPAVDKAVRIAQLGVQLGLQSFGERGRAEADALVAGVLIQHSDELLEQWRGDLEADGEALVHAATALPTTDLDDTRSVLRAGADALAAWTAAVEAVARFDLATTGFATLAGLQRIDTSGHRHRVLRFAAVDLDTAEQIEADTGGRAPTAWNVACSGATPALPTVSEFRRRRSALDQERRDRAAAAVEAAAHPRASV
ncbi:hypothetical protein [Antrihabitans stalactiti]|uniref:Uncharacterized protein n=1 Tax=Antrihabitans stalactiti TaxID=2584121 RepID=A0A848K671_9NOCA|nr:hypothetical protein [Antrihabitans stalactiti]NMN93899.1 hypothetical protein [Antrihabitans stalactiti]